MELGAYATDQALLFPSSTGQPGKEEEGKTLQLASQPPAPLPPTPEVRAQSRCVLFILDRTL